MKKSELWQPALIIALFFVVIYKFGADIIMMIR